MVELRLNKGLVALIDDCDWERLRNFRWRAKWDHRAHSFYVLRDIRGVPGVRLTTRCMHQDILCVERGTIVDHVNHNTLDNRRANLRICTASQNMANRAKQSGTSSRFKGVTLHRKTGRWQAAIFRNGRGFYLGLHSTEEAAAMAYDVAALDKFGEFALTNKQLGLLENNQ